MQKSQAGIIRPLNVVGDHNQLPVLRERVEKLNQRMEQARLPRLGKVRRQGRRVDQARGHGWHQRGYLGQQDWCNRAQPGLGHSLASLRGKVDHRLIRDGTFDFVAIRYQYGYGLLLRIGRRFVHQPAFADTRLPLQQHHVAVPRREPGDQANKLPVFIAASDERQLLVTSVCKLVSRGCGAHGLDRQRIQLQAIGQLRRARGCQKCRPLQYRNEEVFCQALSQPL